MSMNAIAILRVPPSVALAALGDDGPSTAPLSDAVCVALGVSLASEPDALAARLRELVGDLLEVHDDPRGVPVFPERYTLEASSWDAAVEELGEAADWIRLRSEAAPAHPMAAMLGGMDPAAMLGGMDPEAMRGMLGGQDPAALLGGVDPAMLQGLLGGGDASALMETAMKMMGQLADTGALAELAKNMGGAAPDLLAQGVGGLDMEAMAAQAQAALAADPALEAKLRGALGEAAAPPDDDASGDGEDAG